MPLDRMDYTLIILLALSLGAPIAVVSTWFF
jgi:hypothetical protein